MSNIEMSSRDPYPFPKLENDANFYGPSSTQKDPYGQPTHMAQKTDPWNRLNSTCTLASARREIYHHDPKAPRDSLDFVLKSKYNNHEELLRSKAETLVQPETIGAEHGRVLKNRMPEPEVDPTLSSPTGKLKVVGIHNPKKESIHSVKGAVGGHHTPATNQGFSRKHDGGFYTT